MKSMTKKLTVLLVVALLIATMCLLVACGKDDGGNEVKATPGKFTVQVLLPDGTPAKDIMVQLCVATDAEEGGKCYNPQRVDDKGVSVQECEEDLMEIHLMSMPAGYKQKDGDVNKRIGKGELVVIQLENA